MKIVHSMPPNIDAIFKRFGQENIGPDVVFAYGDTLYVPREGVEIPDHLMAHEETHQRQQGDDVEGWWKRYLEDDLFRLNQEIEAYRNQYQFMKSAGYGRAERRRMLDILARDLSSKIYGKIILKKTAKEVISAVREGD